MKRLFPLVVAVVLCLAGAPPRADVCMRVLLRAASFDRNLSDRVGAEATLLIAYNSRDAESMETLRSNQAERARLSGMRLGGADLKIVEVDLRTMVSWDEEIESHHPDAVLVLPGTDSWIPAIAEDAVRSGYFTLGHGHEPHGVAISVSLGADARPVVTVDRGVAEATGMDLSSQLLRLAVVR